MTKPEYLRAILNNLLNDFSDWVKIELREDYGGGDYFIFRMDNYNICISEREFLFDCAMRGNVKLMCLETEFNEDSAKRASKRIEDIVAKLYVKNLFKGYGY